MVLCISCLLVLASSTLAVAQTDSEPPVLHSLSAAPAVVSVSSGQAIVTIEATISDDLSGVHHEGSLCGDICYPTTIEIHSPSRTKYGSAFVDHVSGDLYTVRFRFTQFSELGVWNIEYVRLNDNAGNEREMFVGDLQAAGLSASVEVTNEPPVQHPMTVSLSLTKHLIARGVAAPQDGDGACAISAIKISRRTPYGWRSVSSRVTDASGAFRIELPDRTGRYKASVTPKTSEDGMDACSAAESSVIRHRHG